MIAAVPRIKTTPLEEVASIEFGTRVTRKRDAGALYPVYGGGGATFSIDRYNREDCYIVSRFAMSEECVRYVPGKFFLNDSGLSVTARDPGTLLQHYLDKFLLSKQQEIYSLGRGAAQRNLNVSAFKVLAVPIFSLDEQERIVSILDQAFAALDRARAHAEANLADAQALFDSVLVATIDDLVLQSEMMTLASAAKDFSRGRSRHRPRNAPALYGGRYPFIQTGDIRKSEGSIREFSQTYSEAGLAQSKLWPAGTVCITIAANIAETGVMEFEGCFPDSVIGMVPDPGVADPYYVEYMLRYFAEELKQKGKGAAQDNINLGTFESALFPFPSLEEQRAVAEKLDGIAAYTKQARQHYEQAVDDIAALRQSLLQQAFSGQLSELHHD